MSTRQIAPVLPLAGVLALLFSGACAASGGSPSTAAESDAASDSGSIGSGQDGSPSETGGPEAAGHPTDASGTDASGADAPGDAAGSDARETGAVPAEAAAAEGGAAEGGSGCSALPFCADFEKDTAGMPPSAATWTVTTGCGMTDPNSTVTVDDTQAHGGMRSVKVVGGGNTCGPLFTSTSAFAGLAGDVFGRFFVRFSAGMPQEHSAFLVLGLSADAGVAMNPSNGLQLTGQLAVLDWNWHDATLPSIDTMGAATSIDPTPNRWTCIEWETNATTGAIAAWVDGAPVAGLTFDPGTTPVQGSVNNGWSTGRPTSLTPATLSLGWISYGGTMMTAWFDDVALAGSRIGCQ